MNEVGYDNLTIRKICEVADVSTGKFYSIFKSKDDLLCFYYTKALESSDNILKENSENQNVEEQLITYCINMCNSTANLGLDFCKNSFNPKNQEMTTTIFDQRMIEAIRSYLETVIKDGFTLSDNRTPYEVSNDLCVIVKGVFFDWSSNDGKYDIAEFMEGLLRRCIKGIL